MKAVLFLLIREGSSAEDSRPLFLTDDVELIAAVGRQLARRLGVPERDRVLKLERLEKRVE